MSCITKSLNEFARAIALYRGVKKRERERGKRRKAIKARGTRSHLREPIAKRYLTMSHRSVSRDVRRLEIAVAATDSPSTGIKPRAGSGRRSLFPVKGRGFPLERTMIPESGSAFSSPVYSPSPLLPAHRPFLVKVAKLQHRVDSSRIGGHKFHRARRLSIMAKSFKSVSIAVAVADCNGPEEAPKSRG